MKYLPAKYDEENWWIVDEAGKNVSQLITGQEFYPTLEACQTVCDRLAKTPMFTTGMLEVSDSEDVSYVRITLPQTALDKFERGMQLAFHARKELPHMGFDGVSWWLPSDVVEIFGYDGFDKLVAVRLDYATIVFGGDYSFHVRGKSKDFDDEWETRQGYLLPIFSPVAVA